MKRRVRILVCALMIWAIYLAQMVIVYAEGARGGG